VWITVTVRGNALFPPAFPGTQFAGDRTVHLRLIETTDLHLHLLPYDYYADRPAPGIGLISAARLIEEARAEAPNTLLFDNGDFLQGTPLGDFMAFERGLREGDLHPVMAAMNALSFDALTLGNHEFNYGLDFLMKTLAGAACPVVSANLLTAPEGQGGKPLVRPYALLDRILVDEGGQAHPCRVGVIGFAPPQVVDWDRHILAGRIWAQDILGAANRWLPEMRAAGADVIVALAHTGIGAARHTDGMENAALPLARLDGIDALMTGHSHLLFPSPAFAALPGVDVQAGTIAGKPVVMGGCWGAHIGLIDLAMTREGGTWRVLGSHAQTRALPRPEAGPQLPAQKGARATAPARAIHAVTEAHEATLTAIRRPVGHTDQPLHTFFAHLTGGAALALISEAQRAFVSERLVDPGLRALPVLSAAAPFKAGGRSGPQGYTDVAAGPLALRHIADLYAFPNAIAALRVTGAEVLEWLERSAAAFNRFRPGTSETMLRNADVPGYNFEVIDALDVTYDLSQPARYDLQGALLDWRARRVAQALFQGQPLDPMAEFILCTNSYRASGAGCFAGAVRGKLVLGGENLIRDILRQYVAGLGTVIINPRGSVGFTPLPDTAALFETSPAARAHLPEIAPFAPQERGLTRAGFLRLRLDLGATS
jgi:2',3'-cyclic-nucleotide 2'-phosphodiesterase/3'-nucleotidase